MKKKHIYRFYGGSLLTPLLLKILGLEADDFGFHLDFLIGKGEDGSVKLHAFVDDYGGGPEHHERQHRKLHSHELFVQRLIRARSEYCFNVPEKFERLLLPIHNQEDVKYQDWIDRAAQEMDQDDAQVREVLEIARQTFGLAKSNGPTNEK